ncbi:hypothetical protein CDV55_101319 [Aspergillus turcosus]|uniref:Uncharacterized protein n=1 Tax=Aspergillus turcosus TaxID=1245748 RepID=A0A229WWK7_9EURO|nr:hypothetical protein CDV55_101319 [Aspergillus turcosus]RLL93347.1 hypothetical protein CFD26_101497 [Aspergillus turcosus]
MVDDLVLSSAADPNVEELNSANILTIILATTLTATLMIIIMAILVTILILILMTIQQLQQSNSEPIAPAMVFIELKKCYKSAQTQKTLAELKRKAASDAKDFPDHSKVYKEWIAKHHIEQTKGFAILHRIKALEALSRYANTSQSKSDIKSDSKGDSTDPPPYTSTTIDKIISSLGVLYREHLKAVDQIVSAPPKGGQDDTGMGGTPGEVCEARGLLRTTVRVLQCVSSRTLHPLVEWETEKGWCVRALYKRVPVL